MSCNTSNSKLEQSLELADTNRVELEKVLSHYAANPKDTLKYKAACFLIENMSIHYYKNENPEYYPIMDSLNQTKFGNDTVYAKFDSIQKRMHTSDLTIFSDLKTLTSKFLIEHIDKSFEIFDKSPWANKIKFSDFCEYILPYSVSTEKREIWIDYYKNKYMHYMSFYLQHTDTDYIALDDYCKTINDSLIKHGKLIIYHGGLRNYPPIMIDRIRSGSCEEYVSRTIYLMRSMGMPVTSDFTPQWQSLHMSHGWNTLLTENGRFRPFMGFESSFREWGYDYTFNYSKIFRKTYSIQPGSLPQQNLNEPIPGFLNQSNIIDVSAEYFPVTDVSVHIKYNQNINLKVVYLCVFNNEDWIPVFWGLIKKDNVVFKNMGKGLVYLPAYYTKKGFIAASDPFVLDLLGRVQPLVPNTTLKQTLILSRKFNPKRATPFASRMLNGRFQGANDTSFNHCEDIFTIRKRPQMRMNYVKVNNETKFRYVRYIGGPQSFTNIAQLEFYSKVGDQLKKLSGKVIGTNGSFCNDPYTKKESVFDADILTFFDAPQNQDCWVGLDLGKETKIDEIHYFPRTDDNSIRIGDEYELFYWSESGWCSLGVKKGVSDVLKYNQCPVDALFLLRDNSRGREERIFTSKNGKQIWW